MENIRVNISKNQPANAQSWNKIAHNCGNLLQSTFYDPVSAFYNHKPIYFELFQDNTLIGGVKLYCWESNKLGKITAGMSRSFSQFGELILDPNFAESNKKLIGILSDTVERYLDENQVTTFTAGGFYGNNDLLISLHQKPNKRTEFFSLYVDIDKPDEDLLSSFKKNKIQDIKKARKNNLKFEIITDIERFINFEKQVYLKQPAKRPPNFDYIKNSEQKLPEENVTMAVVSDGQTDLSCNLCTCYGNVSYWNFGGTIKNSKGAGNFLHFELMKYLRDKGIKKYYLGQTAKYIDEKNKKFTVGITKFKRWFGGVELDSSKSFYVLKPLHNTLWNVLLKAYNFFNHIS